jgi:error-prone DNA polymerase
LRSQPMGFWSPNTLVADARRHGVKALPPMVGLSEDRCSLEPLSGSCELALRLGLDQVHGVGGEVAKKIADNGPYRSVTDLARRCLLNEGQISALAKAGALEFIDHGRSRRQSLWGAKEVSLEAKDGRLFAEMEPPPELPQLSLFDRYVMDISSVGVVVDGHPMDLIRSLLGDEVVTSKDLLEIESGSKVIVAGVVTHRQRPGTAKGVTFLSLEDEFGLMNIVCSVGVWKRYRSVARFRDDLVITGKLERQETVVNIVAHKIEPLAISSNIRPRNFH